jgi:hypothetical protein
VARFDERDGPNLSHCTHQLDGELIRDINHLQQDAVILLQFGGVLDQEVTQFGVSRVCHTPFSLKGAFEFLKRNPPKNSENFDISQSHNLLPARCLQKTVEASIYKIAENSENFNILQSRCCQQGTCKSIKGMMQHPTLA